MPRDYKFHKPTCPECGCSAGDIVMGDPSFVIARCPHCGKIFVARSYDGKIQTYLANEHQIKEYYALNPQVAVIHNEDSKTTQIE